MSERQRFIEALDYYKEAILTNFTAEKNEEAAREDVIRAYDEEAEHYRKRIQDETKGGAK